MIPRFSIAAGAFIVWAVLSAPSAGVAASRGTGAGGGCVPGGNIVACNSGNHPGGGTVKQTIVITGDGCTIVDDGNLDDPPAPGVLGFDNDPDDGQILAQCPQLAPSPAPAGIPLIPPSAGGISLPACTQAPPSKWYDPQDPKYGIPAIAPMWAPQAQAISSKLFSALFGFEVFLIGLQALLHRQDITHFISTFAFKIFVVTFFLYLIANAPSVFPKVFGSFQIAGQSIAKAGNTEAWGLYDMYKQADVASALFFCAAMASHIEDQQTSLEFGTFGTPGPPGSGDLGHMFEGTIGHITFEFLVQILGMLVLAGAGIMFLSLALMTAESYITMFAGVFLLGFSSMRFTLPFTQGYLSYAVNVGTKMFTFWILIAVESSILYPVLLRAGTQLINASYIQFGAQAAQSQELYLIGASVDVAQIVLFSALTWFLPNAMGRFISNRNSSSAINVINAMARSIKLASFPVTSLAGDGLPMLISPRPLGSMRANPFRRNMPDADQAPMPPMPPMTRPDTPAPSEMLTLPPPYSPVAPAAAAARSIDDVVTISGNNKQAVQASVSDGPDPFAVRPKIEPIVVIQERQKRSGANSPIERHTPDDLILQNLLEDLLNPNSSPVIGFSNTIARPSSDIHASSTQAPANSTTSGKSVREFQHKPQEKSAGTPDENSSSSMVRTPPKSPAPQGSTRETPFSSYMTVNHQAQTPPTTTPKTPPPVSPAAAAATARVHVPQIENHAASELMSENSIEETLKPKSSHVIDFTSPTLSDENVSPSEAMRRNAAAALGKLGDTRAVEPLITVLGDKDRDVRRNAVAALGQLGDSRAVEPLITALRDEDRDVRRNAATALGKLGDTRAVEPLIKALGDSYYELRLNVAAALAALGQLQWMNLVNGDTEDFKNNVLGHTNFNVPEVIEDLIKAAERGDLAAVKSLIAKTSDVNAKTGKYGITALMEASRGGHIKVVEVLIAAGAEINAKDNNGVTALMPASYFGRLNVVQTLIAAGADVNAKDATGHTALMGAAHKGHREVEQALLAGGARKFAEPFFENVFDEAFWTNHFNALIGSILCNIKEIKGSNIIAYARWIFQKSIALAIQLVRRAENTREPEIIVLHCPGSNVCLLVTALPWKHVDIVSKLGAFLGIDQNAYESYLDAELRAARLKLDKSVTHWLHIMLGMVDGEIQISAGRFTDTDCVWEAYCYPAELVVDTQDEYFMNAVPLSMNEDAKNADTEVRFLGRAIAPRQPSGDDLRV
jgi:hypothetical protein